MSTDRTEAERLADEQQWINEHRWWIEKRGRDLWPYNEYARFIDLLGDRSDKIADLYDDLARARSDADQRKDTIATLRQERDAAWEHIPRLRRERDDALRQYGECVDEFARAKTDWLKERDAATREAETLREEVGRLRVVADEARKTRNQVGATVGLCDALAALDEAPAQPTTDDTRCPQCRKTLAEAGRCDCKFVAGARAALSPTTDDVCPDCGGPTDENGDCAFIREDREQNAAYPDPGPALKRALIRSSQRAAHHRRRREVMQHPTGRDASEPLRPDNARPPSLEAGAPTTDDVEQCPDLDLSWDDADPGTCTRCGEPWEWVRPGKSQPTCDCNEPFAQEAQPESPRPVTDDVERAREPIRWLLCCGRADHCDSANRCDDISPDGYARRYGCESGEYDEPALRVSQWHAAALTAACTQGSKGPRRDAGDGDASDT